MDEDGVSSRGPRKSMNATQRQKKEQEQVLRTVERRDTKNRDTIGERSQDTTNCAERVAQ